MKKVEQKQNRLCLGISLVEVLVGVFLMLIVFAGIFGAYQLVLKVVALSKARIIAISVANEQLEKVRNLSYDDVGVESGYPPGSLPAATTTVRNGIRFKIEYQVEYVIDSKDGIDCDSGNSIPDDKTYRLSLGDYDCCPNDYKNVNVKVSWEGKSRGSLSIATTIAPKNSEEECNQKGGLIKVEADNQAGEKVFSPTIKVTKLSNGFVWTKEPAGGVSYFLLEPTSTADYMVEVSKAGYSSSRTYGIGDVYQGKTIAIPDHSNIALSEGELEEHTFFIDKLARFAIQTREAKANHIYYVRKSGSDSNDGLSPDTAFLTIQKACSAADDGDFVFVGAGDYQEMVEIENSGTLQEPIVFVADTEGAYTGDKGEVKISSREAGFYIEDKRYIKIYGFKIENTTGTAGIYIKGALANNIEIVDNAISNNQGAGIRVDQASDILISHNEIFSNRDGIFLNNADSSSLIGNVVYSHSWDGIKVVDSNRATVRFNQVFSNQERGILVYGASNNCEILDNTVYKNQLDGIQVFNQPASILVLGNRSFSNLGYGISFKTDVFNTNKIASNLVYLNQKSGILLEDNCFGNTISNNTVFQNQENGILIKDNSDNNEIKNNIIASSAFSGIKVQNSTNTLAVYNDLWRNNPNYDGISSGTGSISVDPLFVDIDGEDNILGGDYGDDDSFHLKQTSAGQVTTSLCVDAGSDTASNLEMDDKTTRTDDALDSGIVDMGFHYSLDSSPSFVTPDPFGAKIPNTDFNLRGEKTVGKDAGNEAIYKYSATSTTDGSGDLNLSDMEWDYYHFSDFSSVGISLDLMISYPAPASGGETRVYLAPDSTTTVKLGLKAENTLLARINDASTTKPIFAASVRVYNSTYDHTKATETDGEAYFIPLEEDNYQVEVTTSGYATSTQSVYVTGHKEITINMSKL